MLGAGLPVMATFEQTSETVRNRMVASVGGTRGSRGNQLL